MYRDFSLREFLLPLGLVVLRTVLVLCCVLGSQILTSAGKEKLKDCLKKTDKLFSNTELEAYPEESAEMPKVGSLWVKFVPICLSTCDATMQERACGQMAK